MSTIKSLAFLAALSSSILVGCSAAAPGDTDPGTDPGPGSDPTGPGSDDAPKPLDATGKYKMSSTFDLASNMPGTVGTVVNTFIDATNDGDDPAKWILEQVIANMPNGTFKNIVQGAAPFIQGYLNDRLLDIAPDFVNTILIVGNDFGDMATHTGLNSTLEVTKAGDTFMSVHTVTGAHFKVENVDMDFPFADYDVANTVVNNVGVTLDATGKVSIADHKVPVSYGKILRIGLDAAIIPLVDPNATNLEELLKDKISCEAVGQAIADAVGFGSASMYESACNGGLHTGANLIYSQIENIDGSALEFDMTGTAKGIDTNQDGKVDTIQGGKWAGQLSYGGTPAPLATATFNGSRM